MPSTTLPNLQTEGFRGLDFSNPLKRILQTQFGEVSIPWWFKVRVYSGHDVRCFGRVIHLTCVLEAAECVIEVTPAKRKRVSHLPKCKTAILRVGRDVKPLALPEMFFEFAVTTIEDLALDLYERDTRIGWKAKTKPLPVSPILDPKVLFSRTGISTRCPFCSQPNEDRSIWAGSFLGWVHPLCWLSVNPSSVQEFTL